MKSQVAFLAGLTAGAALAALFASHSGKEARKALRRKAKDSADQIASLTEKVSSQVKGAAAKGKEQVEEALEAGTQAYRAQVSRT